MTSKRIRYIICTGLAVLLVLSSCGGENVINNQSATEDNSSVDTTQGFSSEISFDETTEDFAEESVAESSENSENTAVIYYLTVPGGERLETKTVSTSGKPEDIVAALIAHETLSERAALNSFRYEGTTGWIDMNKAYGDDVGAGTYAEWLHISALINSFLASYNLEQIWLTVDGETLVTGHHGSFDYALGYQENLV